jgi:hypothetical protein
MGSDCIEGAGATTEKGYKLRAIYIGGRSFNVRQHRMAWELEHGPIPNGLMILHHCDNPACVNINHLYLGTHAENMADRQARSRTATSQSFNGRKTHCSWGHEYSKENTHLTPEGWRVCKTCRSSRVRRR